MPGRADLRAPAGAGTARGLTLISIRWPWRSSVQRDRLADRDGLDGILDARHAVDGPMPDGEDHVALADAGLGGRGPGSHRDDPDARSTSRPRSASARP